MALIHRVAGSGLDRMSRTIRHGDFCKLVVAPLVSFPLNAGKGVLHLIQGASQLRYLASKHEGINYNKLSNAEISIIVKC